MTALTRRTFLTATASLAAGPALGQVPGSGEVDVVIIGAGAAGIAAARRVAGAGRRYALVEAADRIGGRCLTETTTFGVPYDRGARWLHRPELNPLIPLAGRLGLEIYEARREIALRIGRRPPREAELERFYSAQVRSERAIREGIRSGRDSSCAQLMPRDLGEWRPTMDFVLGPFSCAKDLDQVSAIDFATSAERDDDAFCREGLGTLVQRLGRDVAVRTGVTVEAIATVGGGRLDVRTNRGTLRARAVILTVSTGVLAANRIRFEPELPPRWREAIGRLSLGTYERIALELPGNPLGLAPDTLVIAKAENERECGMLANVGGSAVSYLDVGGRFGRALSAEGDAAMTAFAIDWLAERFGSDVRARVARRHVTRWGSDPLVRGSFSAAAPGGAGARRVLQEPVRERLFLAGEATHETLWGTVGGAWDSGVRAAEAALRRIARG